MKKKILKATHNPTTQLTDIVAYLLHRGIVQSPPW